MIRIRTIMNKKKFVIAMVFSLLMLGSAFAVSTLASNGPQSVLSSPQSGQVYNSVPSASSSNTPWSMPTTTMQEPSYTNGTFKMGIDCNVGNLNPFQERTYCDAYVVEELYDSLFSTLPNGTVVPWLASGYSVSHVTSHNSTFNIETNSTQNYSYVYTINLRPYVQWTDWTAQNASQTYQFSNTVNFNYNGNGTSHTYSSYNTTTMKKYYFQSADVVQSWRMQASCGDWPNVVNIIPNGNLSVKVFVTKQTLLLFTSDFANNMLPYHIWIKHDFTSIPGLYNYTPGISSGNGWYDWNMGWNTVTGRSPGSVGTGPFMVQNSYGLPQGAIIPSHLEKMYVNPHYFAQYTSKSSGLRQYTPKFYEIYEPFYSSESSMVAAYQKGQIDTTSLAPSPSFLPQVQSTPGSYIYHKTSSAYGYYGINTRAAPLNVTAFRQALNYATPTAYILSTIQDGYGKLSSDPVNPSNLLYYNSSAPLYSLNMAKATALIKSIPGMKNTSSGLTYYGKPVVITIQTTVGAVAPTNIEAITATEKYWNELGIKVNLKEEAFTTLINNLVGSIVQNSTLYQMISLGVSTPIGDPALDCRDTLNPAYGVPIGTYGGPFSSMSVNGKMITGNQVQSLFDNLTAKLVNTANLTEAEKLAKRIQSLMIEQATIVNLGYGIDLIPQQTNTFTNYSHTNPEAQYLYWYWQFFSLQAVSNAKAVHYKYNLKVEQKFTGSLAETAGDTGSIVYTVFNETTGMPVQGATVSVATSSIAGGLLNTTPNKLTTNAQGQATWSYKVFSGLNNLLVSCNAAGIPQNIPDEIVNVSAFVSPPSSQPQTELNSTYQNIVLTHTNQTSTLELTSKYNGNSHLYAGNSASISYTVKNSTGSAVGDANITVVVSGVPGSITSKAFSFNTSTSNTGTFYFNVSKLLSELMQTYSSGNPMYLYDQEVNITAVVSLGGHNQTGAGTASNSVFLINPALVMSYAMGSSSYKSGQSGNITFTVTENGTAVSGAHVQLTSLNLKGLTYSNSSLNMTTNSKGVAVFSFKVGNATSGSGSYVTVNQSLVAKASTSNSSLLPATDNVHYSVSEKVLKPPASNTLMYVIIGVIAAVVVIVAAAFVVMRKPKVKS